MKLNFVILFTFCFVTVASLPQPPADLNYHGYWNHSLATFASFSQRLTGRVQIIWFGLQHDSLPKSLTNEESSIEKSTTSVQSVSSAEFIQLKSHGASCVCDSGQSGRNGHGDPATNFEEYFQKASTAFIAVMSYLGSSRLYADFALWVVVFVGALITTRDRHRAMEIADYVIDFIRRDERIRPGAAAPMQLDGNDENQNQNQNQVYEAVNEAVNEADEADD